MAKQPLSGPIKPQNPIGIFASTLRKWIPLVNEKGEPSGEFGVRNPKDPPPTLHQFIPICGAAIMEVHDFIAQHKQLQKDTTQLVQNFRALRDDYLQLGDILNNFAHLNAQDTEAIERAQAAARDYLVRLDQSRKPINTGDTATVDGKHPDLKIVPKPEADTQGGDSTLGVGGE